jgi:Zn-dependent protease
MAAESYACMRASRADRDRSLEVVKASFVEGRLTKEELDLRVGQVLVSRFFAELMALTADLPVGPFGRLPAHPVTPAFPRLSRLAIVALACAIAGPLSAGLTAVPAIVVGHGARRQIRRTGERGMDVATVAVVLGWLTLLVAILAAVFAA